MQHSNVLTKTVKYVRRHFCRNLKMNNNIKMNDRMLNNLNGEVDRATRHASTTLVTKCASLKATFKAVEQLAANNVIALPTDTVYGLACNANSREAIQKLYEIKGREETKPVAICVATISDVRHWGQAEHLADELLVQLLPGAVTIVLNRSPALDNPYLNRGVCKIGIRIPDFPFIQQLCREYEWPIALTSANRSSEKSTLNIDEFCGLWPQLGGVFDGGQLGLTEDQRAASTVVDLSTPGFYQIIRTGVAVHNTIEVIRRYGLREEERS